MPAQIIKMSAKAIFANLQTEPIIGMSRGTFGNAMIAKHHDIPAIEPRGKTHRTRAIQNLENQSLQTITRGAGTGRHSRAQRKTSAQILSRANARKAY